MMSRLVRLAVVAALAALPAPGHAAGPRYFYYFHGKVVEDHGPRGVDPRFGAYDLPGIVKAFDQAGFTVIAEVRPKNTDPSAYADHIVALIRDQIAHGVPAADIIVSGASKGSLIAQLVSSRLKQRDVRYVLLANCNDFMIRRWDPRLTGKVLSIYETTDEIGHSCKPTAARSPEIAAFKEIRLTTGLGHGMVYRPLDAWVKPAIRWSKQDHR